MECSQSGPLGIFWDIENCPVPVDVRPEDVAGNIRSTLKAQRITDGAVAVFSAYGDFNCFSKRVREGCQRTGVKLIDVPNGHKDAADKAILIDMLLFAMDNRPPSTIMLISGDVDFSSALHILSQRGYTVILAVRSALQTSTALKNAGHFVCEWPSLARGQGFVLPHKPQPLPSLSQPEHSWNSVGYHLSYLSKSSATTQACYNRSTMLCAPPRNLKALKGQLVKLLELSGGKLPLAHLSVEYSRNYGRPLCISNRGAIKLVNLLKKMSDSFSIEGKGSKKIVCLHGLRSAPVCPNSMGKSGPMNDLAPSRKSSNEKVSAILVHHSQQPINDNLIKFKHELEEIMVSYSCHIFLGRFEEFYQLRYKRKLDYRSFGLKNLEELLSKMTDVVELQEDPENNGRFIVPVCRV